jgi:hypothetical protein
MFTFFVFSHSAQQIPYVHSISDFWGLQASAYSFGSRSTTLFSTYPINRSISIQKGKAQFDKFFNHVPPEGVKEK